MEKDYWVELEYKVKSDKISVKDLNFEPERIDEFLDFYMKAQLCKGKGEIKPNGKSNYDIKIGFSESRKGFYTESEINNASITTGIIKKFREKRSKNEQYGLEGVAEI